MKMPPYWMSLRVVDQGRTKFRMWLPLFLLWLLLLPLLLLALVVTLLLDLVYLLMGQDPRPGFTRFLFGVLSIMNATRGTEIRINDKKDARQSVVLTLR